VNFPGFIIFVKKHPIGMGCAVLALLLAVMTFVRAGSLTEYEALLVERTDQSDRLKNNLRYSAQMDEHLAIMQQAVEEIESKAINPGALATNLQFFYRLEEELGLTLQELRQGIVVESKEPREYLAVPYTVSVQGTYLQLLDLLQRLEQGERVVQFTTANISPSRGIEAQRADPTNPLLVLTLDLVLLGQS
jgi:Tfp pilus assembly protein PilO